MARDWDEGQRPRDDWRDRQRMNYREELDEERRFGGYGGRRPREMDVDTERRRGQADDRDFGTGDRPDRGYGAYGPRSADPPRAAMDPGRHEFREDYGGRDFGTHSEGRTMGGEMGHPGHEHGYGEEYGRGSDRRAGYDRDYGRTSGPGGRYGGYRGAGRGAPGPGYLGRGYGGEGERDWHGGGHERSWWDRASDEVSSWFGDEDAERRREREDHRGRGPKGYRRTDARIAEDVNDRIADDPYVDGREMEVHVSDGEVTLNGYVDSRSAKRRAEDVADSVSGVTHCQNNLRVRRRAEAEMEGTRATTGAAPRDPGLTAGGGVTGAGTGGATSGANAGTTGIGSPEKERPRH